MTVVMYEATSSSKRYRYSAVQAFMKKLRAD
jgi:hypothetical protein